ncbi:MAG TPA: cyclic pyranopterin monophosphate synthase MoaC [Gemmatimonadaceae bacterium]|nr:cyclic pyranopterin monophosphate synthase MoaC [Gemmatimonadaceae bacterium]
MREPRARKLKQNARPPVRLSHLSRTGEVRMVDVGPKASTARRARAEGRIRMTARALKVIRTNALTKGDVLAVARVAGITAAKRTSDLIPLCHPLPLTDVSVALTLDAELPGVRVEATVSAVAQTGVEMEALTAVAVALLTVYDMAKSVDRGMRIEGVRLLEKTGGKGGVYRAKG